jgi:hypothetical protein
VIGKIPSKDDHIKVNGMIFEIISSDDLKGRFIAKI